MPGLSLCLPKISWVFWLKGRIFVTVAILVPGVGICKFTVSKVFTEYGLIVTGLETKVSNPVWKYPLIGYGVIQVEILYMLITNHLILQ